MDNGLFMGFVYLLLGAVCGGSFGLPSKYVRQNTPWENVWGPFFLFVTVAMPFALGPLLVKDFFAVYRHVGLAGLLMPLVFGFLWGMGSMALGMSFAFIGLSLAYSLNYGAQIIFGAITPMALHNRDRICTAQGGVILLGVAVCVIGVVFSGRAGILKDRSLRKDQAGSANANTGQPPRMLVGLIIAVLSGFLCACYGVAASYTGPVAEAAQKEFLNEPWRASCATTIVILWGGAFSSCLYCAGLLTKNGTWKNLFRPRRGVDRADRAGNGLPAQRRNLPVQPRLSEARRPGCFRGLRVLHVLCHHRGQRARLPYGRMERCQPAERRLGCGRHRRADRRRLHPGRGQRDGPGLEIHPDAPTDPFFVAVVEFVLIALAAVVLDTQAKQRPARKTSPSPTRLQDEVAAEVDVLPQVAVHGSEG